MAPHADGTTTDAADMRDFLALYRPALRLLFATYARRCRPLPPLSAVALPSFVASAGIDSANDGNHGGGIGGGDVDALTFTAEQRSAERMWWGRASDYASTANPSAGQEPPKCASLNAAEFLTMSVEIGLVPHIIGRSTAIHHFRMICAQERANEHCFLAFVECLVRIAAARYSARSMAESQVPT